MRSTRYFPARTSPSRTSRSILRSRWSNVELIVSSKTSSSSLTTSVSGNGSGIEITAHLSKKGRDCLDEKQGQLEREEDSREDRRCP
jgi:hypothetical protein